MELKEFHFSQVTFELRYADGYRCLDVPGEILKRWASKFDPGFEWGVDGLRLQRKGDSLDFRVSIKQLFFTMAEVSTFDYFRDHVCPIAEDILNLLEVSERERAGIRFHLMFPAKSRNDAAERIRRTGMQITDEIWNALGGSTIGAGVTLVSEAGATQRRLVITSAERITQAPKNIPEFGVMVDFDYGSQKDLSKLLLRSFMNEGFAVLREHILPVCDRIVKG